MVSIHETHVKQKKPFGLIIAIVIITLLAVGLVYYSSFYLPSKNIISQWGEKNDTIDKENLHNDTSANNEFSILDNIIGDCDAIQRIKSRKSQLALLNYFNNSELSDGWEVHSTLKDGEPYTAPDNVVTDNNPKFTDLAVIIQNVLTCERKLVVFGFNNDETLAWTEDFDIPDEETANEIKNTPDTVRGAPSEIRNAINEKNAAGENKKSAYLILVSKQELNLSVYDFDGNEMYKFPIACSAFYGDKKVKGDHKTPEGLFPITEKLYSAYITHDFKDGNGEIPGAYGPYFLRLGVPGYIDIGIHGTHDPASMGKRVTEGCIRLRNENILHIVPLVRIGTTVIITSSIEDAKVG